MAGPNCMSRSKERKTASSSSKHSAWTARLEEDGFSAKINKNSLPLSSEQVFPVKAVPYVYFSFYARKFAFAITVFKAQSYYENK